MKLSLNEKNEPKKKYLRTFWIGFSSGFFAIIGVLWLVGTFLFFLAGGKNMSNPFVGLLIVFSQTDSWVNIFFAILAGFGIGARAVLMQWTFFSKNENCTKMNKSKLSEAQKLSIACKMIEVGGRRMLLGFTVFFVGNTSALLLGSCYG